MNCIPNKTPNEMKGNEKFLAISVSILMLSLLFVLPGRLGAVDAWDTETTDSYQESVSGGDPRDSSAWADEGEEGYEEEPYEEEYSEEAEEKEGMEYESEPSHLEDESAPQWPSDEEGLPPTRYSDDDMAERSIEE